MEGSIVRLHVTNFVTFHETTLLPNQNLNLITGPNGSGKSSLMCALCLGLGGKTKVVGRASSVSEFIRFNAEKATIEIELFNPQGRNYIVSRTINRDNKSSWSIGGFSCAQKEVENLASKLNIQVDNLCQFLPQDRVQDFAKMNSITLMENTEKCVGGLEMWENHMQLKKLGAAYMESEKVLNSKLEHLADEEQIFSSLQVAVDKMTSKKALIAKVELLKQKQALFVYDNSNQELKMCEEILKGKSLALKAVVKLSKPIEGNLAKAKLNLKACEDKLITVSSLYTKCHSSTETDFELPETINDRCKENISDYERMLANEKKRLEKLRNMKVQIEYLENLLQDMDEKGLEEKEMKLAIEEKEVMKQMYSIQRERQSVEMKILNVENQIKVVEQEIAKANDVNSLKFQLLKSRGLYEPMMWFRSNKDKFRGKAYEPMIMVINMKSRNMAKYLESVVSYRDLIAFVCENPEDSNFMMTELRDKLKYKVNVITSKPNVDMSSFTRPFELQSLAKYGFHSYVSDIFTAPESIMRYLFKNYNLHRIPIGDHSTFLKAHEVPKEIKVFMSDDKKFIIRTSKYNQQSISTSVQIKEPTLLTNSVNEANMKEYTVRISKLKEELLSLKNILSRLESREGNYDENVQKIVKDRSEYKATLSKVKTTKSRIVALQRDIEETKGKECKEEDMKKNLEIENQKCTSKLISALSKNVDNLKKFGDIIIMMKLSQSEIHKARNNMSSIETELRAVSKKLKDAEKEEKTSRDIFAEANRRTNKYLKQFEELASVKYNSKDFEQIKKKYADFPETLEDIEKEIHITQTKAECLGHSDGDVIKEYERRQTAIIAIKNVINHHSTDLKNSKEEIEVLKI
ncbi:structural maintenance of chromosomes protein 5 isoform X2 [Hetaerina americana]|uniref:structural maintenance of chromosomes protein 5 isoform X2 n=1 Tax=Hetaerina americana TaxID=62018 RepID=UPI003A7F5A6F